MTATAAYLGVAGPLGADPVQEEIRKHRVAEREGRRTRRRQAREARGEARHRDGESSDEEMPSKDQAVMDKVRRRGMDWAGNHGRNEGWDIFKTKVSDSYHF